MDIYDLCREMVEKKASDLYLAVARPLTFRVDGSFETATSEAFKPKDLEELAKSIRDSVSLRGDVRATSAQGRMTGTVLTILPIAIAIIMCLTSPSYIGVLWHHPQGKYLIAGAAACLMLGHFTIRRIVNIKA